jgi:hypothetical protein
VAPSVVNRFNVKLKLSFLLRRVLGAPAAAEQEEKKRDKKMII